MAKMTQKRKSVLDWQIANRRADSYILDLAYNLMHPPLPVPVEVDDAILKHGISHLGAKGKFTMRRLPGRIDVMFEWTSATDVGPLPQFLSEYIVQYFSKYHMEDQMVFTLPFYTEYKRNGQFFRAHHNYHHGGNSKWYD